MPASPGGDSTAPMLADAPLTIQPSGIAVTGTTLASASAENLSATMTSVGSTNSTPLA